VLPEQPSGLHQADPVTTIGLLGADALMALAGLGLLVLLGVAPTTGELRRRAALAPLTGMAAVGLIGATVEPFHIGIGPMALFLLAAVAVGAGLWRLRTAPAVPAPAWTTVDRAAVVGSVVVLAVVLATAVATFRIKPLAEYDGWAMWAMKGRALAALGWADPAVFGNELFDGPHPEYPLLVPVLHAVGIRSAGAYEGRLVVLQCLVIGLAGLLALFGIFRDRVRPAVLLPAIVAVAAAPVVLVQLATAYADVPLALLVAAGVAASSRWLVDTGAPWLALAVVFFAAAALTKNEGLLYACAALAGLLLVSRGRRLQVVVAGVVVGLAILPWRLRIASKPAGAGDYDLAKPLGSGGLDDRLGRAAEAAGRLIGYVTDTGRVGILLPLAVVLAVAAVVAGRRDLGGFVLAFVALSLGGLTWIYAISPLDLDVYLRLSADRVTTAAVLGAAAAVPLLVEELGLSRRRAPIPPPGSSSG
jgi:hypothetical protein